MNELLMTLNVVVLLCQQIRTILLMIHSSRRSCHSCLSSEIGCLTRWTVTVVLGQLLSKTLRLYHLLLFRNLVLLLLLLILWEIIRGGLCNRPQKIGDTGCSRCWVLPCRLLEGSKRLMELFQIAIRGCCNDAVDDITLVLTIRLLSRPTITGITAFNELPDSSVGRHLYSSK